MSATDLIRLPLEVLFNILKNLQPCDLRNVMLTCKFLYNYVLNDNTLWKNIYGKDLLVHSPKECKPNVFLSAYNHCRISYNWRNGIYKDKVITQHPANYMPWIQYYESQWLFITVGPLLRCYALDRRKGYQSMVWQLDVPKVKRNDIRTNDISRFILRNNILVCGNRDGSTAVYQLHKTNRRPGLTRFIEDCHDDGLREVSAVEVAGSEDDPYVITASYKNSQIHCWHCSMFEAENDGQPLTFSDDVVQDVGYRCLSYNNIRNRLAAGPNGKCKPIVIDLQSGRILSKPQFTVSSRQAVRDIQWHNENTVSYVTHSGHLRCLDTRTNDIVYNAIDPFQCTLYCLKTDGLNSILVGSSEYSRCVLFDRRKSSHHVQMYFTQKKSSPVYSLDFDSSMIIAAADRSVATLNFNISVSRVSKRDYSEKFEIVKR